MTRDDPAYICQPNARAFKLFGTMQTVEWLKQSLRMAHVKANPVIAHENDQLLLALVPEANLDPSRIARACVLDGIGEQVHEHLAEQRRIALRSG